MFAALASSLLGIGLVAGPPAEHSLDEALSVDAAEHACLEVGRLADQVQIWLGQESIDQRVRIEARADPKRRDRVHFRVLRDDEVLVDRPFEPVPEECEATHAALGLAVAIAIDSTVLAPFAEVADRATEPEPEADEPELDPEPVEPESDPEPEAARARVAVRVQATGSGGLHPAAGFGGRVLTELTLRPIVALRFGAGASRGLAAPIGEGEANVSLFVGHVDLCLGGRAGRAELRGCLGAEAGPAVAKGRDQARDVQTFGAWIAGLAGFSLVVPADSKIAFALDAELVAPLLKPRLVVTDVQSGDIDAALDLPPVGGVLSVGPLFRFP